MLEWLLPERQEIVSVGEEVEKRNPHPSLVGMRIGAAPVENSMEILQKKLAIELPAIPLLDIYPKTGNH